MAATAETFFREDLGIWSSVDIDNAEWQRCLIIVIERPVTGWWVEQYKLPFKIP